MNNSNVETKAIGSIIRAWLLTLLVLILCTCNSARLTLGSQTLGKQTDYSLYSGKLARQTHVVTECVTLKIDDPAFHLWLQEKPLTKQRYLQMLDLVYCPSLDPMLRRCLQIRLYQYQSITPSFSSQYRTEWIGQKQNLPIEFPRQDLQENLYKTSKTKNYSKVSTRQLTGKTQETTRMMVKN